MVLPKPVQGHPCPEGGWQIDRDSWHNHWCQQDDEKAQKQVGKLPKPLEATQENKDIRLIYTYGNYRDNNLIMAE